MVTRRRGLGHRVHGIHQQVHHHLVQEHFIAGADARTQRQIGRRLNLPPPHVVSDERKALMDDDVEVDRFRVQLTASEHGPMAIDDLCGLDRFCLDVGENLPHRARASNVRR